MKKLLLAFLLYSGSIFSFSLDEQLKEYVEIELENFEIDKGSGYVYFQWLKKSSLNDFMNLDEIQKLSIEPGQTIRIIKKDTFLDKIILICKKWGVEYKLDFGKINNEFPKIYKIDWSCNIGNLTCCQYLSR